MRDALLAAVDRLRWRVRRHRALAWGVASAGLIGVLVVGGLVVGAVLGLPAPRAMWPHSAPEVAPQAQVVTPSRTAVTPAPSRPVAGTRPTTSPSESPTATLPGRELAAAWLTGYLTRTSGGDDRWVEAVRDLTTPDLLRQLSNAGPELVGLGDLGSWRVARIVPITAADAPADTPSRTVLAYAAVVTDGQRRVERPFELYCYRGLDGRWLVAAVEQPYASEG